MSRKKSSAKKNISLDAKYKSAIIPKLINSLMYDGKKTIAEKIVYDAIEKSFRGVPSIFSYSVIRKQDLS